MKKAYIIIFLCQAFTLCQAQISTVNRATAEQLPFENRADYIKQATNFLRMYYSQLLLNVDELMIREEYIKANMSDNAQRYRPEFMLVSNNNMSFLTPEQYLQELGKQYREYNTDKIEITVDNVNINQDDFFMPNIVKLYVIAEYDLTLSYEEKILFKRRCRAYCLFPKAMVYINVKLMQVEPVRNIVAYVSVDKKKETETKNQKTTIQDTSIAATQTVSNQSSKNYDYIGEYKYGIAVVRKDNKYGFIKEDGTILVQPIYEAIGCKYDGTEVNDKTTWYPYYKFISVKKNGKWGCISQEDKVIVPFKYDKIEEYWDHDKLVIWVMKDNKYGCVNDKGIEVIPVIYENNIEFYKDQPAGTKLNGKWGCINIEGKTVIPFIYPFKVDFIQSKNYAPAKKDNKYGYVNRRGEWIIPNIYDYAGPFKDGWASVKIKGKMGFIDVNGNIVISAIYEPALYINGDVQKDGQEYLCEGYNFIQDRVAVKQNGKWGLIDRNNKTVIPHIYDKLHNVASLSWDGIIDKDTIYLDANGNEYPSNQRRMTMSDSIMAEQGLMVAIISEAFRHYGMSHYKDALKWFNKAAEQDKHKFYSIRAKCYYYAKDETKSYPKALELFKNAAEENEREAMYFLGWMYEHGQGCKENTAEAIRWYKKADNYSDSQKRLEELDKAYANGYEYVDLGLSVKWATCNLGASVPEEMGDRYAWGEFNTKSSFTKKNCTTYKYKNMMNISGREYWDAARSNRKGLWRTPTEAESSELINKCKWDWTELNGKTGYKVTGPNEKSIFIPFNKYSQSVIRYWTASSDEKKTAKSLISSWLNSPSIVYSERYNGHFIRPVIE